MTPAVAQTIPATAVAEVASITPANQPFLDAAADDAQRIADKAFTEAVVDDNANLVHLYLSHARQSVIDQLTALHPGIYTFDNTAVHSRTFLLSLADSVSARISSWRASGVDIASLDPMLNGKLKIGVASHVRSARSQLHARYGDSTVSVGLDPEPTTVTSYRYSDSSPWNGGDFIYNKTNGVGYDCSSGYPVHSANGTQYLLTAAHCFWSAGGVGTGVRNGFVKNDFTVYGSGTLMGSVSKSDRLTSGATVLDTALIKTSSSTLDFDAAWDSGGKAVQIGGLQNHIGDNVCSSGAFDGQICGSLSITDLDLTKCPMGVNWCVNRLARAVDSRDASLVAVGEGDSGGPVYSYSGSNVQVRGMIDQGTTQVTCASVPTGSSGRPCFHVLFFTEIGPINSQWGIVPNA